MRVLSYTRLFAVHSLFPNIDSQSASQTNIVSWIQSENEKNKNKIKNSYIIKKYIEVENENKTADWEWTKFELCVFIWTKINLIIIIHF